MGPISAIRMMPYLPFETRISAENASIEGNGILFSPYVYLLYNIRFEPKDYAAF